MDPIVGNLRYVQAGTFVQGSPEDEACWSSDETRFTHTPTKNPAVMETEATRQTWADPKAAQPSLPECPTQTTYGLGMGDPVRRMTGFEAVLFAKTGCRTPVSR